MLFELADELELTRAVRPIHRCRSPRGLDVLAKEVELPDGSVILSDRGLYYSVPALGVAIAFACMATIAALTRQPGEPWSVVAFFVLVSIAAIAYGILQAAHYSELHFQRDTVRYTRHLLFRKEQRELSPEALFLCNFSMRHEAHRLRFSMLSWLLALVQDPRRLRHGFLLWSPEMSEPLIAAMSCTEHKLEYCWSNFEHSSILNAVIGPKVTVHIKRIPLL